ncbi:MAG: hypothetical protein SAJ37_03685 [Oscillatoria sp. PMC 1068.18]|nr:hypothetical protein [Oscillatoria sp. PMC 1076.18]MEC4987829.1 hypothetical protein [Oscillatoria sp. PMC 1068.18]
MKQEQPTILVTGGEGYLSSDAVQALPQQGYIETAKEVTGREIETIECDRRPGDPAILVGSGEKAYQILGWEPKYPHLQEMITHAWNWHQKRHGLPKQATSLINSSKY